MRALSRREQREYEAIRRRVLEGWKAGKYATAAECKAALKTDTAHLGTPIPPALVAKAVREHGDRGLGALDVAAEWTLSGASRSTPSPSSPRDERQRTRPRARGHRARSPGRRTGAEDGDPEPDDVARSGLLVIPLDSFQQEVDYRLSQGRRR